MATAAAAWAGVSGAQAETARWEDVGNVAGADGMACSHYWLSCSWLSNRGRDVLLVALGLAGRVRLSRSRGERPISGKPGFESEWRTETGDRRWKRLNKEDDDEKRVEQGTVRQGIQQLTKQEPFHCPPAAQAGSPVLLLEWTGCCSGSLSRWHCPRQAAFGVTLGPHVISIISSAQLWPRCDFLFLLLLTHPEESTCPGSFNQRHLETLVSRALDNSRHYEVTCSAPTQKCKRPEERRLQGPAAACIRTTLHKFPPRLCNAGIARPRSRSGMALTSVSHP